MLEIKTLRNDYNLVRTNLLKRKNPDFLKLLDKFKVLDEKSRVMRKNVENLRSERNKISSEFGKTKKKSLLLDVKKTNLKLNEFERDLKNIETARRLTRMRIPNLISETVPYGVSDESNVEIKRFGKIEGKKEWMKGHEEILEKKGLIDLERARKISGARFYFLKGILAKLQMGLMFESINFLEKKGYTPVIPPHMMRRKPYEGVTDLTDFEEVMYKISDEDLYLIATSEHPLTGMFMDEIILKKDIPIRQAGYSFCFRKEVGSHGKDTKGIFRVHRFGKVEQLVLTNPEDSEKEHQRMLKISEIFWKKMEVPFRVVNICTGDLGIIANKKYDIETWNPVQNTFREVCSLSNCKSYQTTRLNIKTQKNPGDEKNYLHTLNGTLTTDTRPFVALIENLQDKNGMVRIPKFLQKYTGVKKF